jgi:uncharacterized protein YegJ (DUF2314 family)
MVAASDALPPVMWKLRIEQRGVGAAWLTAHARPFTLDPVLLEHDGRLTRGERSRVARARTSVTLTWDAAGERVLRDRKLFLRLARAIMGRGAIALVDVLSERLWTPEALDDEISFDADLDVDGLYQIHGVTAEVGTAVQWLHTHGLSALGAFDFDILNPDEHLVFGRQDVLRAIAFAILDGDASERADPFELAVPDGNVRFVPAVEFMQTAAPHDAAMRSASGEHNDSRVVICEPSSSTYTQMTGKPCPSLYTSAPEEPGSVVRLSKNATELTATRARASRELLRRASDALRAVRHTTLVKLGYETSGGSREHLWVEVHNFRGNAVEATLINHPHDVPGLLAGARSQHSLDRITDWMIMTQDGIVTSRDTTPLRRLREAGIIRVR